ncbi:FtsX-like permease family protein [Streptomyces sp. NPDC001889]
MTLSADRRPIAPPVHERRGPVTVWLRDLCLGLRFGAHGGREGWIRNALTATGVGLGVALLLIASSLPQIMDSRDDRLDARTPAGMLRAEPFEPSATSLVWAQAGTEYRGRTVGGHLLRADGDRPALPPGAGRMPGPGEMLVSPALAGLLGSPEGRMLAGRLDHRTVGTIGKSGLVDPGELLFYAGSATITAENGGARTDGYGGPRIDYGPVAPVFTALATLICVVLLAPVAVFIATGVRFSGELRDRRLAALRLVGADIRTTRRIAAGEALFGSALGLAVGFGIFALARLFAGSVRIWGLSAFPSDVVPVPGLGALVLLAVPVGSVLVTLVALRSVTIEPLGVVRNAAPRRRRLWWRLLLPVLGVAVLLASDAVAARQAPGTIHSRPLAAGAILVLLGVTALFPWVVDAVVGRLRGGPVSWQLAVRGLQLRSGAAARSVSGIMVAVAGAIALQMVFAGMHDDFRRNNGSHPLWHQLEISADYPSTGTARRMSAEFGATEGVSEALSMVETSVYAQGRDPDDSREPWSAGLTIADCRVLTRLARIASCADGDVFLLSSNRSPEARTWVDRMARTGGVLLLEGPGPERLRWNLPRNTPTVTPHRPAETAWQHDGLYATPGALDTGRLSEGSTRVLVEADENVPEAQEHIRNTAARIDPSLAVWTIRTPGQEQKYTSIHNGLLAGATGTMVLIAASMLISQIERLRERRRLLPVLVAFGTRRATLARSLLWQTALPVVLGTAVAVASGLVLGAVLLRLINKELTDWWLFLPVAGTGAGVILLVTVVSLPALWRMTRPDGLRTE